jgi:4-hydroxy-tetrahydrodipicolinate reductase
MVKAVVSGAAGRMGKAIIRVLSGVEGIVLTGALEGEGNVSLGEDAGRMAGVGKAEVPLTTDIEPLLKDADVLIDFTAPRAALKHMEACAETDVAVVVGTTGFSPEETEAFTLFAQRTRTVFAPNMSVGVNLLFKLAEMAALSLGDSYDVEIVEAHHRMKKDAPSGTALRLAEIVASALGRDLDADAVYTRHGMIGERTDNEIGIQTIRAGDIVGEHTLLLAGPGERLELTHRAHSRDNFAQGAVRAALWVVDQSPGLYSMADVLGLD